MTIEELRAEHPELVEQIAAEARAASAAPSTAAELIAAFNDPDDREFLFGRLQIAATMSEHQAAYASHLHKANITLRGEISTLKNEVGRLDPSQAGTTRIRTPQVPPSGEAMGEHAENEIRQAGGNILHALASQTRMVGRPSPGAAGGGQR